MKKYLMDFVILIHVCTMIFLTTGCWDYKELTDKIIIAGAAIDYNEENNGLLITLEIIQPEESGKESKFTSKIYQSKGKNMIDAAQNVASKTGHKLLWSHSKIIILSEEIIEKEYLLTGIMDWVERDFKSRQNTHLIMSQEDTAAEILTESDHQTEQFISYYLDHLILSKNENGFVVQTQYWEFMNSLNSSSGWAALPCVHLEGSQTGNMPYMINTELIKKTSALCRLDNKQTKILLLLYKKRNNLLFILNQSEDDTTQNITFQTTINNVSMEPAYVDGELSMDIHLDLDAVITEVDSDKDIFNEESLDALKKDLTDMITAEINNFLYYLQNKGADVLGFANKVEQKYPEKWKELQNNWESEFEELLLNIEVNLEISSSDQSLKITKVGK